MADKKNAAEGGSVNDAKAADKADKKKPAEGGSVKDAKCTDKTAKKKAAPPEVKAEAAPAPAPAPRVKSVKIPKLAKKNKSRLPRREKKARAKAARGL